MTYQEALAIVRTKYETRRSGPHCELVITGLTYDGCNGFSVHIYNYDDRGPVITEIGETKEIYDEVKEEEWKALCAENGYEFNCWRIEKPFTCLEDLDNYIEFLDGVCDKYFGIYIISE